MADMNGIIVPMLTRSRIAVIIVAKVIKTNCIFLFLDKMRHKFLIDLSKSLSFFTSIIIIN
jgi:Na+-transporting NADH:ubiquinone oxidoreductase subunit NqrD